MKVYAIVSINEYDSEARKAKLTHYSDDEGFKVILSLMCGRTLVSGKHKIVEAKDQDTIATCKRCVERAAKKVMTHKENKPQPMSMLEILDEVLN